MRWPFVRRAHYDHLVSINDRLIGVLGRHGDALDTQTATLGLINASNRSIATTLSLIASTLNLPAARSAPAFNAMDMTDEEVRALVERIVGAVDDALGERVELLDLADSKPLIPPS